MTYRRVAILIDGGFFLKRLRRLVDTEQCDTAEKITRCINRLCRQHIKFLTDDDSPQWRRHVYRIFFYDALPYEGKAHHPVDNQAIDFAKSDVAQARHALFDHLRRQRKVALRLGKVSKDREWTIHPRHTKKLMKTRGLLSELNLFQTPDDTPPKGTTQLTLTPEQTQNLLKLRDLWTGLDSNAVTLGLRQKGVDMRIGIDIASLTLKRQVDTIVLVAGDSDFVPAAKLARREGIEFILDPLWQKVNDDLFEHIDGLQSGLPNPSSTADS